MHDYDDPFKRFLDELPFWADSDQTCTIFNASNGHSLCVEPLNRYQGAKSSLCYMITSANMLFYSLYRRKIELGKSDEEARKDLKLNICRCMRNRFTNQEVHDYIFLNHGGYPKIVLGSLLREWNPTEPQVLKEIDIAYDLSTRWNFKNIRRALNLYGPLLLGCAAFPALSDPGEGLIFGADKVQSPVELAAFPNHAMLIVGIRWTGLSNEKDSPTSGNFELLIQNSWETKPFLVFDYKLIRKLGVKELVAIKPGLRFKLGSDRLDDHTAHTIRSGSGPAHQPTVLDSAFTAVDASSPSAAANDPHVNTTVVFSTNSTDGDSSALDESIGTNN
jgi:hypothetical protein